MCIIFIMLFLFFIQQSKIKCWCVGELKILVEIPLILGMTKRLICVPAQRAIFYCGAWSKDYCLSTCSYRAHFVQYHWDVFILEVM